MTAVADRKYALTRIAAGDYLLPSNDGQTLWRIYAYHEDGSAEWQDGDGNWHKITGRFWGTAKFNRPVHDNLDPDDLLDWENWAPWDSNCKTRAHAIEATLR